MKVIDKLNNDLETQEDKMTQVSSQELEGTAAAAAVSNIIGQQC